MVAKKYHPPCLFCGEETKRATTKFCSKKCEGAYRTLHKIRRGGPKRKYLDKKCEYCGETFRPAHHFYRCCSQSCSGKLRWKEGKDRKWFENGQKALKRRPYKEKLKAVRHMQNISKNNKYTFIGKGGTRKDIGHYVRSRWEANIARVLNYLGCPYEYEKTKFTLYKNGFEYYYTPDFKILKNTFIEVKGWETDNAKMKRILMEEQKPDIKIIYIKEPEYKELYKIFKDVINWEKNKHHGC